MESLTKFVWQDGIYEITLEQHENGFYGCQARDTETGLVDFAVTDYTADDCKRGIWEFIHAGENCVL